MSLALRIAALLLAAASLPLAAAERRETRAVSGFDAIALSAPIQLTILQGDTESLMLEGDEADLAEIETVVENGALKIRLRKRSGNVTFKSTVHATLNAKAVRALSTAGSGDIASGALKGEALHIGVSGSGDVRIDKAAYGDLDVSVSGSGDVTVGGQSDKVGASIAGSGNFKAGSLKARDVRISIAGSGDATVAAKETLKVSIVGSGDVRYYGDPSLNKSVVGSGSVRRAGEAPK